LPVPLFIRKIRIEYGTIEYGTENTGQAKTAAKKD
jgi:hypothetical protein